MGPGDEQTAALSHGGSATGAAAPRTSRPRPSYPCVRTDLASPGPAAWPRETRTGSRTEVHGPVTRSSRKRKHPHLHQPKKDGHPRGGMLPAKRRSRPRRGRALKTPSTWRSRSQRATRIVWFHLHEILEEANARDRTWIAVCPGLGREDGALALTANGGRVSSSGGDEKAPDLAVVMVRQLHTY